MIFGIGTDIVRVDRFADGLERFGRRFAARLLTAFELEEFDRQSRPDAFLAKRFAAKEATAKAMGCGFRSGLSLRHIGVVHDAAGKPALEYLGVARAMKETLGIGASFVTLADEKDYAIAYVTLLKDPRAN